MAAPKLTTKDKALEINLDPMTFGSFTEIGAGQEVARSFFRAGKASATIAKTLCAYDMAYSDFLYGREEHNRYVCESRVRKMLAREYSVLTERTAKRDPKSTRFFAFADTITSRKLIHGGGHGWMGIRFQHSPNVNHSDIVLHVRLLDEDVFTQQEALGIIGTNLIYGAIKHFTNPYQIILGLKDNLKKHHFEIDMIEFSGPAFEGVDNRLMSLYLVAEKLTNAVIFAPDGQTLQPTDTLFKKNLLVLRGRFHPPTKLHREMLASGKRQFLKDPNVDEDNLVSFFEITLNHLLKNGEIDINDFFARVDLIAEMGLIVMISNYMRFYKLNDFFSKHTQNKVGIILGVGHLQNIFSEEYYKDVPGGMMSALGMLFSDNVRGLVFPAHSLDISHPSPDNQIERKIITAASFKPDEKYQDLYNHMINNSSLVDIEELDKKVLEINSENVLKSIYEGNSDWEPTVPDEVAAVIKEKKLFCYKRSC